MADEMPAPPYPEPYDAILKTVVESAVAAYEAGEVNVRGAVLHAAVHGWLEGHMEGEECGEGCYMNPRWRGHGDPELN